MTMTKEYNKLDKTFNITPEVVEEKTTSLERSTPPPDRLVKDDIEKDYEYTRGNLYSIIEKGQEAINGILEIAQESEMPRAYEVAGQLIKSVSDATDKLMTLQQKLKDVEEEVIDLTGSPTKCDPIVVPSLPRSTVKSLPLIAVT